MEAKLYALQKQLKAEGKEEVEIEELINAKREEMMQEIEDGVVPNSKESQRGQSALFAKQKHMEVFKNALNIGKEHKFGEAFDVELQEKKRL